MAKPKRSKRNVNLEYTVNGDYVTLVFAEWEKVRKRWHECTFIFNAEHLEYIQSLKGIIQPHILSVMCSERYCHFKEVPIIEFNYCVSDGVYKAIKMNEVCNYIAVQEDGYLVVTKGDYSDYKLDEHSVKFDTLDEAKNYLESLN